MYKSFKFKTKSISQKISSYIYSDMQFSCSLPPIILKPISQKIWKWSVKGSEPYHLWGFRRLIIEYKVHMVQILSRLEKNSQCYLTPAWGWGGLSPFLKVSMSQKMQMNYLLVSHRWPIQMGVKLCWWLSMVKLTLLMFVL